MKSAFRLIIGMMPASRAKNWLLRRTGYRISPSASIGPCLIVHVAEMKLGDSVRIGPFNVFRDLNALILEESSVIGQWNWVSAARPLVLSSMHGALTIERHAALTSRHYVDASGGVSIGEYATVAGVRSTFITHGIDWRSNRQSTKPIRIGAYCLISSNTSLAPGAVVPDGSVVGMGATVAGALPASRSLYISPRADAVKSELHGGYFERSNGFVDAPEESRLPDSSHRGQLSGRSHDSQ